MTRDPSRDVIPLREATRTWFKVSLQTFGGPAGQIAVMHRELVDDRRWIGEQRFLHARSYCTLLPGPEAQQLAIYLGWLLNGTTGGLIAGTTDHGRRVRRFHRRTHLSPRPLSPNHPKMS